MFRYDAVDNGQAQTGTAALGGEKRQKEPLFILGPDAGAAIGHHQFHDVAVEIARRLNPDFFSEGVRKGLSGVVNQDEIQNLLSAGAAEFIRKPFNIAELVEKILTAVESEKVQS